LTQIKAEFVRSVYDRYIMRFLLRAALLIGSAEAKIIPMLLRGCSVQTTAA
jgi:hypothetical protein